MNAYLLRPEEIRLNNVSNLFSSYISDEQDISSPLFSDPRSPHLGYRGILTTQLGTEAILKNQIRLDPTLDYDPIYSVKKILLGCPEIPFDIIPGSSLPFDCNMDIFNYSIY